MRPDSHDTILLMLSRLKDSGVETARLPEDLVVGLLFEPDSEAEH